MELSDLDCIRSRHIIGVDDLSNDKDIVNKMYYYINKTVRNYKGMSKLINTKVRSFKFRRYYYISVYIDFRNEKYSSLVCIEFIIGENKDVELFNYEYKNVIAVNEVIELIGYISKRQYENRREICTYIRDYLQYRYLIMYKDVVVIDKKYIIESGVRDTYDKGRKAILTNIQKMIKKQIKKMICTKEDESIEAKWCSRLCSKICNM